MQRGRLILILLLILTPVVTIGLVGAWELWHSGWWFWLWWMLPVCWGLGWFLARRWNSFEPMRWPETPSLHWTPQDTAAARIVSQEQERVARLPARELTETGFYVDEVTRLANLLGVHYQPGTSSPINHLSVLEVLAVVQLATEDMEEWLNTYVPGSHLLTVGQWKLLSQAPGWWQVASNTAWAASILLDPVNLGRFLVSRFSVDPLSKQLQQNLLGTVAMLFVRQAGFYLIELNSGRLRGGAAKYRAWQRELAGEAQAAHETVAAIGAVAPPVEPEPVAVTIAVVGQVKAGKSSLINCLMGDEHALVDVLPATPTVNRYQLELPGCDERLVLLDTPGYSDAGATEEQIAAAQAAAEQADLVLLVLESRSPARSADRQLLERLAKWYAERPRLKPPPVLAVVNKIDLLNPALEWAPPYSWQIPKRPKELSIRGAVEYATEVFSGLTNGVVATATDRERGRVSGLKEELLPAIAELVDSARATTLLRALHRRYDHERWQALWRQVSEAGSQWRTIWKSMANPRGH